MVVRAPASPSYGPKGKRSTPPPPTVILVLDPVLALPLPTPHGYTYLPTHLPTYYYYYYFGLVGPVVKKLNIMILRRSCSEFLDKCLSLYTCLKSVTPIGVPQLGLLGLHSPPNPAPPTICFF